jgi:CelD/BcsL family acetyltransferase involved in cellulose biosynthesis
MRRAPSAALAPLRRESLLADFEAGVGTSPTDLDALACELVPLTEFIELGKDWEALESFADGSFFTSWTWIHSWISVLPAGIDLWVLKARRAGLLCGLAILVKTRRRVLGLADAESWWLHATGRPECDLVFIEYNDFLVHRGDAPKIRQAMLRHWRASTDPCAEFHAPGVRAEDWAFLSQEDFRQRHHIQQAFSLDMRASGTDTPPNDLTGLLRPNTRSLVRRSRKEFEKQGVIVAREAANTAEALNWFGELLVLNAQRFAAMGVRSNCTDPQFRHFHVHLLAKASPMVRMVRISAGEQLIAYLYAFIHRDRAYAYQAGMDFSNPDNKARPGYVSHMLAASMWAAQGVRVYDFMAGDARYKENLSNQQTALNWLTLHKAQHWAHRLEDLWIAVKQSAWGKACKQWVRDRRSGP